MVSRLLGLFRREIGGLHQAAFLLAGSAFASQLLGFVRDRLLASTFGASRSLDLYYTAFRVPDLVYTTVASFVSVTILIPILITKIEKGDRAGGRAFMNEMLTVFCLGMVAASIVLFIASPLLARLIAPGFTIAEQATLAGFMRILLLSPFILGLSNLLGAVTQAHHRFFVYALSPILYNAGIIIGILALYPLFGLPGLLWGVVLGAILHAAIQIPVVVHCGYWPHFTRDIDWTEVWRIIRVSVPRSITLGLYQASFLVLGALASRLGVGAITVLNFSFNLQSVPLAIVGVSYSVAAFPVLAAHLARGDYEVFRRQVSVAVRHIVLWSFLALALFIVLRAHIVRVVLGGGQFGWNETRLVAAALALFSLSVPAQSLTLLFTRAYYAAGRTYQPLFLDAVASALVIVLAFAAMALAPGFPWLTHTLARFLRVADTSGASVLILPLVFSVGWLANLVMTYMAFRNLFGALERGTWRSIAEITLGAVTAGVGAYALLWLFGGLLNTHTLVGIFIQGLAAGLGGLGCAGIVLGVLRNRELREVTAALRKRVWRTDELLVPNQEAL